MEENSLNYYYNKFKYGEDSYHYLMKNKVNEILLVSTFYDAFIFEQDGRLSEKIFGEYRQLNLSTSPKITSVPTGEEALKILKERKFDLVITMPHIGKIPPFELAKIVKKDNPNIPILLLLNMQSDVKLLENYNAEIKYFDDIFLWSGDTKLFLAMIKSVEDKRNLDYDTKHGLVRVILLVEDSIQYYSIFLPLLYEEIVKQTQILIHEELNDINKRLRMRARPKVILVHNYRDALKIYEKYTDYILAVISDTRYVNNGRIDCEAGIKLISKVKENKYDIPTILLSSDYKNKEKADEVDSTFLYKYSRHLLHELRDFILDNLGFGDFVFKDAKGNEVTRARTLDEFGEKLKSIPDESILYHSKRNHFSAWLMARGEIQVSKKMRLLTIKDFESTNEIRQHLIKVVHTIKRTRNKGKIIKFHPSDLCIPNEISSMSEGSLGGKGRGLAFLNSLLVTMEFEKRFPEVNVTLPSTTIIGTNEFDRFVETNQIYYKISDDTSDYEIDKIFLQGDLSHELRENLNIFLDYVRYPIAVRSSGLLEDSYSEPFAGIYRTYMLPNNNPDKELRLQQLSDAIKLVFASVFIKNAKNYIQNLSHQVEEEKMAIVIQQVVGSDFGKSYFYPHFSGVAQSYNFYPLSYIKNEDGLATLAVGLGKTIIEGNNVFRFCPKYPNMELMQPNVLLKNSQKSFWAINLRNRNFNLIAGEDSTLSKLDINVALEHRSIDEVASTWDYQDSKMIPGVSRKGATVITFYNILKHNSFPLANIIEDILDIGEQSFGMPVEIEFAVDLTKNIKNKINPTFYILQIRPLSVSHDSINVNTKKLNKNDVVIYTTKSMGNGAIEDISDIIYVDPERFNHMKTVDLQNELERINGKMKSQDRRYILVGPGRWGSQERFLGIPIKFVQISNAKVIVETEIDSLNVEPSQGTHFFHNIASRKVGYLTVSKDSSDNFIDWDWIKMQKVVEKSNYFVHIVSEKPLLVKMDGKKGIGVVYKPG